MAYLVDLDKTADKFVKCMQDLIAQPTLFLKQDNADRRLALVSTGMKQNLILDG